MLELLVIPACFLGVGLIGLRLGTPARVAGGLMAVGCCHLVSFLVSRQALQAPEPASAWIHLVSQWFFLGGFVAIVWLAAAYPDRRPSTVVMAVAAALGVVAPTLAALSGPTPAVIDGEQQLGPAFRLLPDAFASLSAAPLLVLPLMAVVIFGVRRHRADPADRLRMRWPIVGTACLVVAVLVGTLVPASQDRLATALFLLTAPVLPLALAFGPVADRIAGLSSALTDAQQVLAERSRPRTRPSALAQLTPREYTVLTEMAEGAANPVIARRLHLSLSSVEKHATSIFRKLGVAEGPEVHRRVAAVVAYRDALDEAGREP